MAHHVRLRGKTFGPFDEEQLKSMKSQGKIGKSTEVSEDKINWILAGNLSFLFPPPLVPSTQPSETSTASTNAVDEAAKSNEPSWDFADWFYSINGTEGFGPVTEMSIVQMLQTGQLHEVSYVWQDGQQARYIKDEPAFSNLCGQTPKKSKAADKNSAHNMANNDHAGTNEINIGTTLRPLAESLGWLMFLKITTLIYLVITGLLTLWSCVFLISSAIGSDSVRGMLLALIIIAIEAAYWCIIVKTFLCFWQYHVDLFRATTTGMEVDLLTANQSLASFWKWLGISLAIVLAMIFIAITVATIIVGFADGSFASAFPTPSLPYVPPLY